MLQVTLDYNQEMCQHLGLRAKYEAKMWEQLNGAYNTSPVSHKYQTYLSVLSSTLTPSTQLSYYECSYKNSSILHSRLKALINISSVSELV
jgi:hypothetical protein